MPNVMFVGCGPGAPDLITLRAQKLIQSAGLIIYSGSLIPKEILQMCSGELVDASGMVREEITAALLGGAQANKLTVRLHDGDPAIYGAIKEQIDALAAKGVSSEVVPGVTSFLASAAALGTQLTLPGVTQTIIITRAEKRTEVPKKESIASLASHGATMVFYLSVHLVKNIVSQALEGGYCESTPAAVVYRASWGDQKAITCTLGTLEQSVRDAKITRTAIIIIGDVISPKSYEHSKLYDKEFSHGYRRAQSKADA